MSLRRRQHQRLLRMLRRRRRCHRRSQSLPKAGGRGPKKREFENFIFLLVISQAI
jgi:hypothetical protein